MSNTDQILGNFIKLKNSIHPLTGKKLSKNKRLKPLFDVIYNNNYDHKFSKEDQLLANRLVEEIINE